VLLPALPRLDEADARHVRKADAAFVWKV